MTCVSSPVCASSDGVVVRSNPGNNLHWGSLGESARQISKHTQEQHNEASGVLYSICEQNMPIVGEWQN